MWRGSVVRMKSSFEMPSRFQSATHRGAMRSVHSWGDTPSSRALRSMFTPCSSVPVRKKTSVPASRFHRAIVSAASVV